MDELIEKAAILHEALPYIGAFTSALVVKYGGHAMVDASSRRAARDVCLLRYVGQVVVVGLAADRRSTRHSSGWA
jgi:acetylglutamate kinase